MEVPPVQYNMLATEPDKFVSSASDILDTEKRVCRPGVSDTTMAADTPPRQPITAVSTALRRCMCSHADYLYFSDICLSQCAEEQVHMQYQQVDITAFYI